MSFTAVDYQPFCSYVSFNDSFYKTMDTSLRFFEVLHFYKAALFRDIMFSPFAKLRHLRSLRARLPDLNDFLQDDAHFQQPCVYL